VGVLSFGACRIFQPWLRRLSYATQYELIGDERDWSSCKVHANYVLNCLQILIEVLRALFFSGIILVGSSRLAPVVFPALREWAQQVASFSGDWLRLRRKTVREAPNYLEVSYLKIKVKKPAKIYRLSR
jgi:hypothetical protein